jgi:hypothetical protein
VAIAYKSQGAGAGTETNAAALNLVCPATVDANDILIAHVIHTGTTTAPSTPANWSLLFGPSNVGTTATARHWCFGKLATGSEDGTTVSFGTAGGTNGRAGRIYSFSGYVSGTLADVVPAASFSGIPHATDPQGPSVTTTIAGALAVALMCQDDNNTPPAITGMTGGTWAENAEYVDATWGPQGVQLSINTATPTANPGTISGGAQVATNDEAGTIGFEIRPSVPEVVVSGTLAATDPVDTASFAGDVIVQGSLSVSEGTQDTASFAGDVIVSGSFALSEGAADTASFSGTVSSNEVSGSLAATDVPDTASVAGTVLVSGTLAATDVADVAAFTGTVADPPVTGSFALTDAPDLAAIVGVVASQLSEDTDLAFFTGTVADLVVSMGEAIVSIAAISATNLPTPQELAGDIDAIKPAGFRNEYYPTDAIHLRDQGEPIVEGMNLSFKNGLPVIYVRSGEKILRHIRKPDGSYKTTVHIRKRFR